jgi:hypothetical protein
MDGKINMKESNITFFENAIAGKHNMTAEQEYYYNVLKEYYICFAVHLTATTNSKNDVIKILKILNKGVNTATATDNWFEKYKWLLKVL